MFGVGYDGVVNRIDPANQRAVADRTPRRFQHMLDINGIHTGKYYVYATVQIGYAVGIPLAPRVLCFLVGIRSQLVDYYRTSGRPTAMFGCAFFL